MSPATTSGDGVVRSGDSIGTSSMTLPGTISLSAGETFAMKYVYNVGYG